MTAQSSLTGFIRLPLSMRSSPHSCSTYSRKPSRLLSMLRCRATSSRRCWATLVTNQGPARGCRTQPWNNVRGALSPRTFALSPQSRLVHPVSPLPIYTVLPSVCYPRPPPLMDRAPLKTTSVKSRSSTSIVKMLSNLYFSEVYPRRRKILVSGCALYLQLRIYYRVRESFSVASTSRTDKATPMAAPDVRAMPLVNGAAG
ncbi:hypothetical protein C8Q74DRAFT_4185 [Fomes fomentarius]|nr:hypothetical protein C8Q74DRAFT_4185 [Fomes fomentarius]